jgi:TetR/AcrR family transcriptional regulator, cholesterol catabolism regulator
MSAGPVSVGLIEQEAIRLFGERTYPMVGMRDIGDAVGLLPGSLYVHISSKEELLLRIVERGITNYLDVIEPVAASAEPAGARLRSMIIAHIRVLAAAMQQTRVAFEQWVYLASDKHQLVIDLRTRYENAFTKVVADGVATGEFHEPVSQKIVVYGTIGMLTAATNWYSPAGALTPDEVGEALAETVLRGLQKPVR